MSDNEVKDQFPGSVFDGPLTAGDQAFLVSQVPCIGKKVVFNDGREFRFCSSAVDVAQGIGVAMAAPASVLTALGAASAKDSFTVTLSVGAVAVNLYAGGFLHIVHDAGVGKTYRIKSNTASTSATSSVLTLYDPIKVALTTATDVAITKSPFANVIVATAVAPFIGVPTCIVTAGTATTTQYFWVQTKGACTMKQTSNVTTGNVLSVDSSGTAITHASSYVVQPIGVCLLGSTTDDAAIWLYGNGL